MIPIVLLGILLYLLCFCYFVSFFININVRYFYSNRALKVYKENKGPPDHQEFVSTDI